MTIDINELRNDAKTAHYGHLPLEVSGSEMLELLDRLEAAEKERDALRAELAQLHKEADKFGDGVDWIQRALQAEAQIEQMERQEPVATIHINSTGNPSVDFIPGHRYLHHNSSLYALPGAQPAPSFADAYQGAMEEVAIWKKRALEAEDLNRKFVAEINGPTYMGEPAQLAPSVPDGWKLVPIEPTPEMLGAGEDTFVPTYTGTPVSAPIDVYRAMLAAAPEAKP